MKRIELHIEHSYKNRFVGRHSLLAKRGLTTLGSARDVHIRLLGDQVGAVHAGIEFNNGRWVIADLGSEFGTWIQKKSIVESEILEATVVNIGHHQLKLTPVVQVTELFGKSETQSLDKGGELFHQIVIRRGGLLVENSLVPVEEPFRMVLAGHEMTLLPPTSENWQITERDGFEFRQRLVKAELLEESGRDKVAVLLDPSLRAPLVLSSFLIAVLAALFFFLPQEPKDTMVALKPEEQNQYTRMIYDAKKIAKQKAESQKLKQRLAATMPEKEKAPQAGGNPKLGGGAGQKAVNNIRSSGLSALIGKISARAAKNAIIVQAAGVTPDVAGSGVALGMGRSVASAAPNQLGTSVGQGHKLAGVGTAGKGGGSSSLKGVGGLAIGNVGSASVGILDDEGEVEGGLDKDVIARYIKSQLGQIRYCYERQLSASPDLYGKILVKFTIGATGTVTTQSIGNSSMGNSMVEGCILRRIAGWQFPSPKGGTQVLVSYPFLFKSTR